MTPQRKEKYEGLHRIANFVNTGLLTTLIAIVVYVYQSDQNRINKRFESNEHDISVVRDLSLQTKQDLNIQKYILKNHLKNKENDN